MTAGTAHWHRLALVGALLLAGACSDPFVPDRNGRVFASVDAGRTHACALTLDGEAFCWGDNDRGQLGVGDNVDRHGPTRVETEARFDAITAGDGHTCALATDHVVLCWGWNPYQQHGSETFWFNVPIPMATAVRFTSIDAGWNHTCGIAEDATVYCWGMGGHGQIGHGAIVESAPVTPVAGGLQAARISAGARHTCAVRADGVLFCWGDHALGQLGIGTGSPEVIVPQPTPVQGNTVFRDVSAGVTHTCAVATNDVPYCWGSNAHGEIGDRTWYVPTLAGYHAPKRVEIGTDAGLIAAGLHVSCMTDRNEIAYCWGHGEYGQLGNANPRDQNSPQPIHVQPGRHFTSDRFRFSDLTVSSGRFACGVVDGSVFCWGSGDQGELGVSGRTYSGLPQRVSF